MKKGVIFIGKPINGKTRELKEIQRKNSLTVSYLDGKKYSPENRFFFSECTENTKIIIIDDLPANVCFESFYSLLAGNFTVNKKDGNSILLNIKHLVLVTDGTLTKEQLPKGSSFTRRFDVLQYIYDLRIF